jgi:multicopper oxidase
MSRPTHIIALSIAVVCTYACRPRSGSGQPFANPVMLTSHNGKLDFHIHQTGFLVTGVNGGSTDFDGLRDTLSVPPARNGKPGEAKLTFLLQTRRFGRFVFHCHVVRHEDKGMMMTVVGAVGRSTLLADSSRHIDLVIETKADVTLHVKTDVIGRP